MSDYRDLVIEELADSEAAHREHIDRLIGIIANLAHDNYILRRLLQREMVARIHGDAALERARAARRELRPRLYQRGAAA